MAAAPLRENHVRTDADIFQAVLECGEVGSIYGPMSDWDVSAVTNMKGLFAGRNDFNENISKWNVSNVTNMYCMFSGAEVFNQNIGAWNVSNVTDMTGMFSGAENFNQNISGWDVSNVVIMSGMFFKAKSFNQNISSWNVSKVTDMSKMFCKAESFCQNLSVWDISNVIDKNKMFDGATAMTIKCAKNSEGYVGKLREKCEEKFLGIDMFFKLFEKETQTLSEYGSYIQEFKPAFAVLSGRKYATWLHIIQLEDDPLLSASIRELVERYPALSTAKDIRGVPCIDLASPGHKLAIMSVFLWFGRYRIVDQSPEHISNTCFVYKAVDEEQKSNLDEATVALKLMRYKTHFMCEVNARHDHSFDPLYVMEVLATHPSVEEAASCPEDALASNDFGVALPTYLTKALAEQMYCLVMPWADRNMFVSLKQQRYAGKDMDTVRYIFKQILSCVAHMHEKHILHADLKPLNIVRQGAVWRVIDLDAACVLGKDSVGLKASTAYVPPEAIFASPASPPSSTAVVCFKSEANRVLYGVTFDLLQADASFDIWSLGCILYQMCTSDVRPLFQGGQDDNLTDLEIDHENNLWILAAWPETVKQRKLSYVTDPNARHLLSLILQKDPTRRPSLARILDHPFMSLKQPVRMIGAEPTFDLFLSYRVATDFKHAEALYDRLTCAGFRVWWDKKCLKPGQNWKEGFCEGLVSSRTFVCLLSRDGTSEPFSRLTKNSRVDNVYLEHRLALELKHLGLIEGVLPVMIGDIEDVELNTFKKFSFMNDLPMSCVDAVETDVVEYLNMQALGSPLQSERSVASVESEIMSHQGGFIIGDYETSLQTIVAAASRGISAPVERLSSSSHSASARAAGDKDVLMKTTTGEVENPENAILALQRRLDDKEIENVALRSENMTLQSRLHDEISALQSQINELLLTRST